MCPQYRQRQTSELNEQGKNDIPVRCQGACAKSRRFLEILQNILISKLSLFYMHFPCQNTGTYSLKKPVNPRKLKVSSTAGRPSPHGPVVQRKTYSPPIVQGNGGTHLFP